MMVLLFDIRTGFPLPPQVWCVCYNSTGTRVASVSDDKSLLVYSCPL